MSLRTLSRANSVEPLIGAVREVGAACGDPPQCRDQSIDVLTGVVKGQRGANCALVPEPAHDRLRAVVAGPHRDSLAVKRAADLLGGEPVENERQYGRLLGGGADQPQASYALQGAGSVGEERVLVAGDVLHPDPLHVGERGAKADGV